jgi:rod shape-determining protein MreC
MAQAQRTGRSRHRLVLLALTAITLLTVDLNGFGPAESAQRVVRDVLNPITSVTSAVLSPIGDAWNSVFNYGDLEAENEAMKEELAALTGEGVRAEADTQTLRRFLAAADLPYVGDIDFVTAEVVRASVGNFDDHVVTISKGSRDGIENGMAVVTAAGLVGRVIDADTSTAAVQLLTDDSLFVGVRLVSTDDVGLGHSVAGEEGAFVIDRGTDLPDTDDPSLLPAIGSAVVTAAESIFPADVPVGLIREVEEAADEVSMIVHVDLAADVGDLHYVSVLLVAPLEEFRLSEVLPGSDAGEGIDADLPGDPDAEAEE